jgi:hypothetical protein
MRIPNVSSAGSEIAIENAQIFRVNEQAVSPLAARFLQDASVCQPRESTSFRSLSNFSELRRIDILKLLEQMPVTRSELLSFV